MNNLIIGLIGATFIIGFIAYAIISDNKKDKIKEDLFQKRLKEANEEMSKLTKFKIKIWFNDAEYRITKPMDYKVFTIWGDIVKQSSYHVCHEKIKNAYKNGFFKDEIWYFSINSISCFEIQEHKGIENEN